MYRFCSQAQKPVFCSNSRGYRFAFSRPAEGCAPGSSAPGVKCAQNRALHRRSPLKERRRLRDFRCEAHFRQRDKVSGPIGTAARPKPIRTPLYNRRSRANGVNHCPDHFVLGLPGARESFQAGSFRKKVPIELAARTNCAWPRTASRAF